jgi:RNA polymerase sigma-70 factor (ECF subfamily)
MPSAVLKLLPTGAAAGERIDDASVDLDAFLRGVEARAYRIALLELRDSEEALDAVQEAMIRLAGRYARRPSAEWAPLFYRILKNRIRDGQRRRAVRAKVIAFFGAFAGGEGDDRDPVAQLAAPLTDDPAEATARDDAMQALAEALRKLPDRQREAFMLRNFEGLDVAQTAAAMGCSEGSVKTHHSRAAQRLRALLGDHWP